MSLIIGIAITAIFYIVLADAIKKYPAIFYLVAYIWCGAVILYFNLGYNHKFPEWFNKYFMDFFGRGTFTTATFMVVMFLGVITKHNKVSRKLMSARGVTMWYLEFSTFR